MLSSDNKGYLYIAFGKRYLHEVEVSARSLKRFTNLPVCLVTNDIHFESKYVDEVIIENAPNDFESKIRGVRKTPYQKTIFLDTDTFVCSSIDNLFQLLDIFDLGLTVDRFNHSYAFFQKYNPSFRLQLENIMPEFHTGVIVYNSSVQVLNLFDDWLNIHEEMHIKADMPSFREAYLKNSDSVRIVPLPFEYNYFGTNSFGIAYGEIKVIHERLGGKWNSLTSIMLPFKQMDKIARKLNKRVCKRIIIPYLGVIPYYYSPYRIKYKLKQIFGIKKTKKAETF